MTDAERAAAEILEWLETGPVGLDLTDSEMRTILLMRVRQIIDRHMC